MVNLSSTNSEKTIDLNSEYFKRIVLEIKEDAEKRRQSKERLHPYKALQLVKEAKLGALRLPIEAGGAGISIRELFEVIIQLAAADSDLTHALRSHFIFVEDTLAAPPSLERTRRLQFIANGELVGNATTEISNKPQGSKQYETTLIRQGDHFLLNGTKYFTTGTLYADWVSVIAAGENKNVHVSVIPTNREGIEIMDDWDGFGQQLTASGTTKFTNVIVKENEAIQLEKEKLSYVTIRQLFLQGVIAGITQQIVEDSIKVIKGRKRTFTHASIDTPTQDPQLLQTVGEIDAIAFSLKTLVLQAADLLDHTLLSTNSVEQKEYYEHEAALRSAQVKIIGERLALQAATQIFDTGGASATRQSAQLDRHWRNIRTIASHNPASYKAKDIGNYLVNQKTLPINGYY
ncbi:acyl-CoA dehydrogenase family protein [Rummeliibacillus pycnus]|uniref:acyl-CoA dehydrogenase family protein n=1 Tax=Rummeliibacillus pycnus TaxID=101070 RepID=UPI000C9A8B09|nr:acyl-CoA dehydrogenase family protein [Rummeliibacillus pycnus]